jgi:hypothetical protein
MAAKTAGAVNVDSRRFVRWRSTVAAAVAPDVDTRANTTLRSFPSTGPRACCDDRKAAGHSVSRVVFCAPAKNRLAFARADRVGARAILAAPRSPAPAPRQPGPV